MTNDYGDYEEDYRENMPCDNTGYCSNSCPIYFTVCHKPEAYRDPFN